MKEDKIGQDERVTARVRPEREIISETILHNDEGGGGGTVR